MEQQVFTELVALIENHFAEDWWEKLVCLPYEKWTGIGWYRINDCWNMVRMRGAMAIYEKLFDAEREGAAAEEA